MEKNPNGVVAIVVAQHHLVVPLPIWGNAHELSSILHPAFNKMVVIPELTSKGHLLISPM
jgi:hypothetical protein